MGFPFEKCFEHILGCFLGSHNLPQCWSSCLFISFLHWSLFSGAFFIVGKLNNLERKKKDLKRSQDHKQITNCKVNPFSNLALLCFSVVSIWNSLSQPVSGLSVPSQMHLAATIPMICNAVPFFNYYDFKWFSLTWMVLHKCIFLKGHELNRNVFSSIFLVLNHHSHSLWQHSVSPILLMFHWRAMFVYIPNFFYSQAPTTRSSELEIGKACILNFQFVFWTDKKWHTKKLFSYN